MREAGSGRARGVQPGGLPDRRYIARQEEHHKKLGFREELIRLLEKSGVRFDEQYLP